MLALQLPKHVANLVDRQHNGQLALTRSTTKFANITQRLLQKFVEQKYQRIQRNRLCRRSNVPLDR